MFARLSYLFFTFSVFLCVHRCQAEITEYCQGLPSDDALTQLLEFEDGGEILDGPYFTCLAQDTEFNTYREVYAKFTFLPYNFIFETYYGVHLFNCSGESWGSSFQILNNSSYNMISQTNRTDCESCNDTELFPLVNEHLCNPCHPSCNDIGLMRCTGPYSSDCCVAFDNDICKADLNCTNSTHVANEENGFICSENVKTVDQSCGENLLVGIVWKESYEKYAITLQCSEMSSKFSDSLFVKFSRECTSSGWLVPSFSSCTLTDTATKPFVIVDVTLIADNVSIVMNNEAAILNQAELLLASFVDYAPSVSMTKYVEYSLGIGFAMEVTFNSYDSRQNFLETLQMMRESAEGFGQFMCVDLCVRCGQFNEYSSPIGGFQQATIENGRHVTAFHLSDPCTCHTTSAIEQNIYFLCSNILVEPCNCSLDTCKCQEPFIGNGKYCTVDSDFDGYPDNDIDIICNDTSTAIYCINDTCPDIYNPEQNPPICKAVFIGCPEETDANYGILWPETPLNTTYTQSCGDGNVIGLARRHCDSSGNWLSVNDTQCQSRVFKEISVLSEMNFVENPSSLNDSELKELSSFSQELIGKLALETTASVDQSTSLFPADLSTSNQAVSGAISVFLENVRRNTTSNIAIEEANQDFGYVFSNLLDNTNQYGWNNLQMIDPTMGSELLLQNAESFGSFLTSNASETQDVVISTPNIVFHAKTVSAKKDIIFPESADLVNFAYQETEQAVILLSANLFSEADSVPVVHTLFNNLQKFIFSSEDSNLAPGTLILSSQIKNPIPLAALRANPINLNFKIITDNFSNPNCGFWKFSNPIGNGSWSTMDIQTIYNNDGSSTVSCLSEHLTSFAVLVDTRGITKEIPDEEALGLSVVTYIGLSISTVCLVVTIVFFATYGKTLFTNVHFFIHLNFGLSLLLSNIVFITGIETADGNKIACTIVAALLHYLYLCVFCWMLCEGIMMYLMLVVVFSNIKKKWWIFMLIGWAAPLLPVVITVSASYDNYTAGTKFCWLSARHRVIWGFVAPVILIIMINALFYVRILFVLLKNRSKYYNKEHKGGTIVISTIKGSIILLPLLGLTWGFGLLAVDQNTTFFAWIFTLLNSFQGVAILLLHVIRNERVYKYFTIKNWKNKKNVIHSNNQEKFKAALNTSKTNETPLAFSSDGDDIVHSKHQLEVVSDDVFGGAARDQESNIEHKSSVQQGVKIRDMELKLPNYIDTEDSTFV